MPDNPYFVDIILAAMEENPIYHWFSWSVLLQHFKQAHVSHSSDGMYLGGRPLQLVENVAKMYTSP